MPLAAGARLGPYEIVAPLGAGGMGEVYRATDTNLKRFVAIKVLPAPVAADADRLARFQREAEILAALNHPNIAAIYGLEKTPSTGSGQADLTALVMELVEGEDLSALIVSGQPEAESGSSRPRDSVSAARRGGEAPRNLRKDGGLPLNDVLRIARQIAAALEAAHDQGILHRDLKPANIKVTDEGVVKVLDFGLAKAMAPEGAMATGDVMNSPTLTAAAFANGYGGPGTQMGVVLGTAAYMAPEQARGKAVDKRVDVWAFGCVLYEMLTGARAFQGEDISDILASVLRSEPDWHALPPETPPALRTLVQGCLAKDRSDRISDISTASFLLREPSVSGGISGIGSTVHLHRKRSWSFGHVAAAAVGAAAVAILATTFTLHGLSGGRSDTAATMARLTIALPSGDVIPRLGVPSLNVSPDGTHVAYAGVRNGKEQLFLRAIDSVECVPIAGTENSVMPFFSPDGEWVGFFANGKLKKASVTGSAVEVLADASGARGGSWGQDGTIYFVPTGRTGVFAVSSSGGAVREITRLDEAKGEISHRFPQILPNGTDILFTIWTGPGWDEHEVAVQSIATGERHTLVHGGNSGRYVASGHLVYAHADSLLAQPMDLQTLTVSRGAPIVLPEQVLSEGEEGAHVAVAHNGSLVYVAGGPGRFERGLAWVDREGNTSALPVPPRHYAELSLSPDGRRVALQIEDGTVGVWIYDFARNTLTPLSTKAGSSQAPLWTPDGTRIVYRGTRAGSRNLYWKPVDTALEEERLTAPMGGVQTPTSWLPNGRVLAFWAPADRTGSDIWTLHLDAEPRLRPFLATSDLESIPAFSPDGHWLAYQSTVSGRPEIYVQPFPGPGARHTISTAGGAEPVWSANGHELFYLNGDAMMVVDITTTPSFSAGPPRKLFDAQYNQFKRTTTGASTFAVSKDGQRFLRIQSLQPERNPAEMQVVLNFFDELRRLAPK